MAKQNRGLGRGLNSLLGGSASEAAPADEIKKERVVVENPKSETNSLVEAEESLSTEKPVNKPDDKETTVRIDDAAEGVVVMRDVSEKRNPSTPSSASKTAEFEPIVADRSKSAPAPSAVKMSDDDVTIKAVVERLPDEVPLTSVKPNPDQPRTNFDEDELEELAASIDRDGLLQPILVRQVGKEYQIIAGERRWQACRQLGMATVPIRIKDANDDKALELALVENIQRSDLNPIEEAYGYRRLMDRQGLTQSEVAQAVSKGRSTVANALRLLELPEAAQQMLFEDKISSGHARAILAIPSKEGKEKLTEKLLEEKLSVREAETYARLLAGQKDKDGNASRKQVPLMYKRVARALKDAFETNVRVKTVKGKNKIEIEFESEEELEQLFVRMTGEEAPAD